jgi:hypothetical protein
MRGRRETAQRSLGNAPQPIGLNEREAAIAAGMIELLSSRAGAQAPAWTSGIGAVREMIVLDPGLEELPRSFARAKDGTRGTPQAQFVRAAGVSRRGVIHARVLSWFAAGRSRAQRAANHPADNPGKGRVRAGRLDHVTVASLRSKASRAPAARSERRAATSPLLRSACPVPLFGMRPTGCRSKRRVLPGSRFRDRTNRASCATNGVLSSCVPDAFGSPDSTRPSTRAPAAGREPEG